MAKKTLITGGAGFIGTHLCRALIARHEAVQVLDLRDPETPVAGVRYVQGDVRDEAAVMPLLADCDAVVHFAAIVSVPLCQEQPVDSYRTNLLSTAILTQCIADLNAKRPQPIHLVFASSAAVYAEVGDVGGPLAEGMVSGRPSSYYGAQKLGCEQLIRIFHQTTGSPCTVFRFFNVFGPGQDPHSPYSGVISIFLKHIAEGLPIKIFGDGKQTRDFVSVHDVAAACAKALALGGKAADGEAINLGSGQTTDILQLAELMMKISGKSLPIQKFPAREGDVRHSLARVTRAKEQLDWRAQVGLEEGLRGLIFPSAGN